MHFECKIARVLLWWRYRAAVRIEDGPACSRVSGSLLGKDRPARKLRQGCVLESPLSLDPAFVAHRGSAHRRKTGSAPGHCSRSWSVTSVASAVWRAVLVPEPKWEDRRQLEHERGQLLGKSA